MEEKYLPIGTVVTLQDADTALMIVGIAAYDDEEPDKVYDYMGCVYPEGITEVGEVELFNHDQIVNVLYMGYVTEASKAINDEIKGAIDEYTSESDIESSTAGQEEVR